MSEQLPTQTRPVMPARRLRNSRLQAVRRHLLGGIVLALLASPSAAHARQEQPRALSDAEFWSIYSTMSEPGGSFVSENFVSNEMSFQHVIPTLQKTLTPGGVYLGVGPEQNFTYIANLRPRLAVIFDIRRQNAVQHLLYKALFEESATRAEFVSRLFSRPAVARLGAGASAAAIFEAAESAPRSDSAFKANLNAIVRRLTVTRGFALSSEDRGLLEYLYNVFNEAGPAINYSYRLDRPWVQNRYPTFGVLQQATNIDGVPMAFLGTEENYRSVRSMHMQNLIVPVVGDFAGPSAIRTVGEFLRKRQLTVTAFYLSNVEQYLFRSREAPERFYGNVASLPLDSTAMFIRSVPGSSRGAMFTSVPFAGPTSGGTGSPVRVTIVDSGNVRVMRAVRDSAGVPVTTVVVDSSAAPQGNTRDSVRAARPLVVDSLVGVTFVVTARDSSVVRGPLQFSASLPAMSLGSLLTSGLMPVRDMLDAWFGGQVRSYQDVIDRTRTSGWK